MTAAATFTPTSTKLFAFVRGNFEDARATHYKPKTSVSDGDDVQNDITPSSVVFSLVSRDQKAHTTYDREHLPSPLPRASDLHHIRSNAIHDSEI